MAGSPTASGPTSGTSTGSGCSHTGRSAESLPAAPLGRGTLHPE
jgi:hypothetical protein